MKREMKQPRWWSPPWATNSELDPDKGDGDVGASNQTGIWRESKTPIEFSDEAILAPLEAKFGQVRSKSRVRELAEVFTHQREVDAILNMMPDAFSALDIKFLEPSCGSGNFLVEILRRKLHLVLKNDCVSQEQYEHRLLRAAASIYGIDISQENVTEARARMAHTLLGHYQSDANTIEPTEGFLHAAALILGDNIVLGDTLNASHEIELCEWNPRPGYRFQRVWSYALVPFAERNLFWAERQQDSEPVHYSELIGARPAAGRGTRKTGANK